MATCTEDGCHTVATFIRQEMARVAASAGGRGSLEAAVRTWQKGTEAIKNNIYTDGAFPARCRGPTSPNKKPPEGGFLLDWL